MIKTNWSAQMIKTNLWISGCRSRDFKLPQLSYQAVFPRDQKNQDKNLNILRTKRTVSMKKKAFFIIFKGLSFFFGRWMLPDGHNRKIIYKKFPYCEMENINKK